VLKFEGVTMAPMRPSWVRHWSSKYANYFFIHSLNVLHIAIIV